VRIVLVTGMGGDADADFLAPLLARHHDVTVTLPGEPVETDADTALIGYSLGAVLAARHAASRPVASLTLVCGWLETTPRLVDWTRHAFDPAFAAHTMLSVEAFGAEVPLRPELVAMAATASVGELAGDIRTPTLVIGATQDAVVGPRQSRLLFGAIPDVRYTEIPTGHAALVEQPARVLALIDDFLARPLRHANGVRFEGAGA
jgi:pimeloyl-ACP methyl ester carboxylesterase